MSNWSSDMGQDLSNKGISQRVLNIDLNYLCFSSFITVCPRSSDPFYILGYYILGDLEVTENLYFRIASKNW